MLNSARWDLDTRPGHPAAAGPVQARAAGGEKLSPQRYAELAIELAAAGLDRDGAVQHAREAVRATHRLMSVTSTALPEAVSVLLFAGLDGEAGEQAQTWLRLAEQRGWPLATAVAASVGLSPSRWASSIWRRRPASSGSKAATACGWPGSRPRS